MERIDKVIHLSEEQAEELFANGKIIVNGEEKTYSDNALYIVPNAMYPVGAVYISTVETSPALLFGGTWERIRGKFLLSASNEYPAGSEGGSADAVVVKHSHKMSTTYEPKETATAQSTSTKAETSWLAATTETTTVGEDGTGKNMPPYLAVFMWKRVA